MEFDNCGAINILVFCLWHDGMKNLLLSKYWMKIKCNDLSPESCQISDICLKNLNHRQRAKVVNERLQYEYKLVILYPFFAMSQSQLLGRLFKVSRLLNLLVQLSITSLLLQSSPDGCRWHKMIFSMWSKVSLVQSISLDQKRWRWTHIVIKSAEGHTVCFIHT